MQSESPTPNINTPIPIQQQESPSTAPNKPSLKIPFIILVSLLIFISGFALAYGLFVKKSPKTDTTVTPTKKTQQKSIEILPTDSNADLTGAPEKKAVTHDVLYTKNGNIFVFTLADNKETQLTTDGSTAIPYTKPQFAGPDAIAYVRCTPVGQGKDPYSCILRKQLKSGHADTIVQVHSSPNSNGFHTGGFIDGYEFNPDGTLLVYTTEVNTVQDNDFGQLEVRLYSLTDKTTTTLSTFKLSGGRGGSLDDDTSIRFSPDGKKVLVHLTYLYPGIQASGTEGVDQGTMIVYDISTKKSIWEQSSAWTANGHFADNDTIIAKQQIVKGNATTDPWSLIRIHIPDRKVETLSSDVAKKHGFEVVGTKAYYWMVSEKSGEGIVVSYFDLLTKTFQKVKENIYKIRVIDDKSMVIKSMVKCDDKGPTETICGMDVFNGMAQSKLGIFQDGEVKEFPINYTNSSLFGDIDAK